MMNLYMLTTNNWTYDERLWDVKLFPELFLKIFITDSKYFDIIYYISFYT